MVKTYRFQQQTYEYKQTLPNGITLWFKRPIGWYGKVMKEGTWLATKGRKVVGQWFQAGYGYILPKTNEYLGYREWVAKLRKKRGRG